MWEGIAAEPSDTNTIPQCALHLAFEHFRLPVSEVRTDDDLRADAITDGLAKGHGNKRQLPARHVSLEELPDRRSNIIRQGFLRVSDCDSEGDPEDLKDKALSYVRNVLRQYIRDKNDAFEEAGLDECIEILRRGKNALNGAIGKQLRFLQDPS